MIDRGGHARTTSRPQELLASGQKAGAQNLNLPPGCRICDRQGRIFSDFQLGQSDLQWDVDLQDWRV